MPPRHADPAAAFWRRVAKQDGGGCWLWTGCCNDDGYGHVRWHNRTVGTHRVAWELANGPIPAGMSVLHNCPGGDNPTCVNPGHLFLGTQAENMADAARKGRTRSWITSAPAADRMKLSNPGERNGRAKLTDADVADLRAAYAAGSRQVDLAARFGIAQTQVSRIVRGEQWRTAA